MEYSVQAKENSVSGGIGKDAGTYSRGSFVVISCNPQDIWFLAENQGLPCNANGLDNHPYDRNGMIINGGTIVGSIDNGMSFFPVGTLCQLSITADNTQLKLYCWDSDKDNNSGAISAYVQAYQVPQ